MDTHNGQDSSLLTKLHETEQRTILVRQQRPNVSWTSNTAVARNPLHLAADKNVLTLRCRQEVHSLSAINPDHLQCSAR